MGTTQSPGPLGATCEYADTTADYPCYHSCLAAGHKCVDKNRSESGCDCSTCVDDILFIEKLLAHVKAILCVDIDRIHVTGFSNGAMFTCVGIESDHCVCTRRPVYGCACPASV